MEIEVGEALPGGRKLRQKCRMGNAEGLQGRSLFFGVFFARKVFLPLLPLTVLSPFPLQLPRQPLLFSAYYVLDLRFITVNF